MAEIPKRIQKPIPLKINPVVQQALQKNKNKHPNEATYSRSQSERSSNLNGEAQLDNLSNAKSNKGLRLPQRRQDTLNSINVDNISGNLPNISNRNLNNLSKNSFQAIPNYQNQSNASDQHVYKSHKFSDQINQQNPPEQEPKQVTRRRGRQNIIEQEFWLRVNIQNAYIPNGHVNWNTELRQAYIRISLLEQVGNNFQLLHKHNQNALSTIQHEYITNINNKTTQMSDKILPITSQPQELFPNSQFYEYFHGENALTNVPEDNAPITDRIGIDHFILNNEDFPIGNSAVCKFCGEKLIFNDQLSSVQEKAFILVEMVQLPNWMSGKETVLGWGVAKISEILKLENEYFELKLFKSVKDNFYDNILNKIYQQRPLDVDYESANIIDSKFLKQAFKNQKIYQPKQIGLLELKFKLLTDKDKIIQERVVTKRPVYPYDIEQGNTVITQTQKTEKANDGIVDFSKYDINVKRALDELYEQSQQYHGQYARQTTFNTQNSSCSAFMSNCISQIAACPKGNVCLGAAAVLCDSEVYMLVLFNILSGQLLCPLGCHFGYVYKLIFTSDGRYLLSCSADGRILVFDVGIFSYYGFNYYYGKNEQVCTEIAQVIAKKRSGTFKLTETEEEVFSSFRDFMAEVQSQKDIYQCFQLGNLQNDLKALQILSNVSSECHGDINKALNEISQSTLEQIYYTLLIHSIDQGVCIYDVVQIEMGAGKHLVNNVSLVQTHDLSVNVQEFPVDLRVVSGNLAGKVCLTYIQQLDVNKPVVCNTQVLYQHDDYVNVVLIQQMKQYDLVISGDSSGIVKFYSLQTMNQAISVKFQAEIQTLKQLKDLALLKTKSKEIRLIALSSTFQTQIFDSTGNIISDINEEVAKYNQNISMNEKIHLKVQDLQLPGTARICTDKQKQFCYVPGYGGAVFCISPNGRVVQAFHIFEDSIQYGCFINQLLYTPMGLLSTHTTIVEEAENILKDFTPHGVPKYSQLPIVLMRYSGNGIMRQFSNGTIKVIQQDQMQQNDTQLQVETPQYVMKEPIQSLGAANETYDEGPVEQMVNDFLKFIQLQRSGLNVEQK